MGLASGSDGAVLPAGISDRVPTSLVLQNPRKTIETTERILDKYFEDGYSITGKATHYLLEVGDFAPVPLWADFGDPVFTGRVTKPSDPGDLVTVYINSSGSATDTQHLTKQFTGGGTSIYVRAEATMPTPVGMVGNDWTVQTEMALRSRTGVTSPLEITDAGNNVLLSVFSTNEGGLELSIKHAGGTDTYDLGTDASHQQISWLPKRYTISWSESTGTLRAWDNKTLTLETPILNPAANVAEAFAYIFRTTSTIAPFTSFCYLRLWDEALFLDGVVDYSEPDFTASNLLRAYECNDIDTSKTMADSGPNAKHIDLSSFDNDDDYYWEGSPNAFIGDSALFEKVIPYAYGNVFHIPLLALNALYNERALGCAVAETIAVFGNGAQHVQEASYGNPAIINADTRMIGVDRDGIVYLDDYCRLFAVGQRVRIHGPTVFAEQTPTIRAIFPDPIHSFKRTSSNLDVYSIRVSELNPATGVFSESPFLSTVVGDEDFGQPWPYTQTALDNPYGGDGESPVYRFNRPTSEPVTACIAGDPTQVVTGLPAEDYVSPATVGNIVSQMLTLNLGWGASEYNIPDYSVLPQYAGAYVKDNETTTRQAVNSVLQGLGWLEEGTDGVFTLKAYKPPTGTPVFTFKQGETISVRRLSKFTKEGEEDVPTAINIGFRRSYTVVDGGSLPDITEPSVRDYLTNEYRTRTVGNLTVGITAPQFNTQLNSAPEAKAVGQNVLDLTRGQTIEIAYRYDSKAMFEDFEMGMEVDGILPDFGYPKFGNKGGIVAGYIPIPYQSIVKVIVAIPDIPTP
jgi:hypothetical protein